MRRVYLDYAAASPVDPRVMEEMLPYFTEKYGNPSSVYSLGFEANSAVEEARERVANLIGAEAREIIFTSTGTESINLALKGMAQKRKSEGGHVVTSSIEHPAALSAVDELERVGFSVSRLPVDDSAIVDADKVRDAITGKTILISVMSANNEVGAIQPVREIGDIAREKGIPFHTDAVAAAGKIPIDVTKDNIDLLSLSSQDLYGPKGVAALYVRKGTSIVPLLHGGRQERKLRPGTESVPLIVGMGRAAEIAAQEMGVESERLSKMRDQLVKGLTSTVKECHLNGRLEKRLPNNANLRLSYIEGESIVLNLDMKGIQAATGSACTSETLEPSHVLTAMGIPPEHAHGSIAFTLGRWTKGDDIDYVIETLPQIVKELRAISPMVPEGWTD
ncbi:MAG: cysteine desulfurase NifS [Candidatus Thermoplasmatota archaeon]|nr:cysteine desulfurase NifS [Candidatus Thermoplasmatota archaeon]